MSRASTVRTMRTIWRTVISIYRHRSGIRNFSSGGGHSPGTKHGPLCAHHEERPWIGIWVLDRAHHEERPWIGIWVLDRATITRPALFQGQRCVLTVSHWSTVCIAGRASKTRDSVRNPAWTACSRASSCSEAAENWEVGKRSSRRALCRSIGSINHWRLIATAYLPMSPSTLAIGKTRCLGRSPITR